MLLRDLFEKKSTAGTAWVILHTTNKLILGKRAPMVNNPNLWNFFGGHIDDGESPEEAAVREMAEEAGLEISTSDLKQVAQIGNATYFSCQVGGMNGMKKTAEISKIQAYKLTQLPDNLHMKTQNFFDRLDALLS